MAVQAIEKIIYMERINVDRAYLDILQQGVKNMQENLLQKL